MTDDIKAYFMEKYAESKVRVVPGHWPDFKSKEAVDTWLTLLNSMWEEARKDKEQDHGQILDQQHISRARQLEAALRGLLRLTDSDDPVEVGCHCTDTGTGAPLNCVWCKAKEALESGAE